MEKDEDLQKMIQSIRCKTMFTIPKISVGQISFRTTIASVGSQCLGLWKRASRCNITNRKG
jgi:hypothetical protein